MCLDLFFLCWEEFHINKEDGTKEEKKKKNLLIGSAPGGFLQPLSIWNTSRQ